jgi:hypothetical protein
VVQQIPQRVVLTTTRYESSGAQGQGALSFFIFPLGLSTRKYQSVDIILIK